MEFELVDGWEWINGTTIWRVTYEYADADGGGETVDYFKTANRYTPPTGVEIRDSPDGDELTVIGIEKIEWFTTDTPEELPSLEEELPADSTHKVLSDLISDR